MYKKSKSNSIQLNMIFFFFFLSVINMIQSKKSRHTSMDCQRAFFPHMLMHAKNKK